MLLIPATALAEPSDAESAAAIERRASDASAEVGVIGAIRGWRTAYGQSKPELAYGLYGSWIPLSWLAVQASVDHTRRTSSPNDLKITNSETLLIVGPRLSVWFDFVRLFVDVAALGAIRTVNYRDAEISSPVRFSPGVSLGGGAAVAVAERVGVSTRIAWRRRDDQAHLLGSLDVSWFFQ